MSTSETSVASVYVLTPLTRDAGQSRRVIVQGFDVPWRSVMIAGCSLIIGIIPTAIAWMFLGHYALMVIPLFMAAGFYLVERRTRSGLRLRTYQAVLDRRRAVIDLFLCCGVPVDPSQNSVRLLKSSSAPAVRLDDLDSIDIALSGSVLSARQSRHEPDIAPIRSPRRIRKEVDEGLFAPSGHESFYSDRGAPKIADTTEADALEAAMSTQWAHHAKHPRFRKTRTTEPSTHTAHSVSRAQRQDRSTP